MTSGTLSGRDPASGEGHRITWRDGLICQISPDDDAPDLFLTAGLVDLQINGYAGHDLNSGHLAPETICAMARAVLRSGTTTFLPTLITARPEKLAAALETIAQTRRADPLTARMVPGIHLEGPWISSEDGPRGAHPVKSVVPPDLDQFDIWQAASGGLVRIVTLSPHWDGSVEAIKGLISRGVIVAIGHTSATAEQIEAAVTAGASLATHLGNGIAASLPRHPNLIWEQLAEDRLSASFIADGHHLSAPTFRAMLRAKGLGRTVLVSDATALAGQPAGFYHQEIGGEVELSPDGRLSIAGTPYLAGAALPLSAMVARAARMGGIGLDDALMLATRTPGRLIGADARIAVGAPADLIRFRWSPGDDRLEIDTVLSGGET